MPAPDGRQVAALVTERLPNGRGAGFVCAEGRAVGALASGPPAFGPGPAGACVALGRGLTRVGGRALARQDGDVLLFLVTDGDLSAAGDLPSMIRVLNSEHVAADSGIRDLAPPHD
ncbi:hypothetical protein ACWEN3_20640 [Streptomyces sp. NPDC004561]